MHPKYHKEGLVPSHGTVYVFGGNLAGKLTSPKARIARNNFRVAYGTTEGLSEMGYCIPVRDKKMACLAEEEVRKAVERFIAFAAANPKTSFFLTRVGCEEGEFDDETMARMFGKCGQNCSLPEEWKMVGQEAVAA